MNSQPVISANSLPQSSRTELNLKGIRISPGLASGTVWLAGDILDGSAEVQRIEPHQVDAEMERIRRAFARVEAGASVNRLIQAWARSFARTG